MKKIILKGDCQSIPFDKVNPYGLIFAKKDGKLVGMVVHDDIGWILMIGGSRGATGYHDSLRECLESYIPYGDEFFVED